MIEKENREYSTVIINNPKNEKFREKWKNTVPIIIIIMKKKIFLLIKRHCLKPFKK